MNRKIDEFLYRIGMHPDRVDIKKGMADFCSHMQDGLQGKPCDLMMLPTYISADSKVPAGKEIVVMDAGGTNFRVATVTFDHSGHPSIANFEKTPMPGTKGRIGREEFFSQIADRIMPLVERSDTVGFCFSYPTTILPNRDGRLIQFNKEVLVDDIEGELIGEGINRALAARGIAPRRFVLLNDTVATMLGGIAITQDFAFDRYIGYILGTGTNTCYLEDCKNIKKDPDAMAMDGLMAINIESGGYSNVPQGEVDREMDAACRNPGKQLLEKMISGAYQGTVIRRLVKKAMEAGLFSEGFCSRFEPLDEVTMYDVDRFCENPYGNNTLAKITAGHDDDTLALYLLIDSSFERAAKLTAMVFAAIIQHTGTGKNPTKPVCIVAEGTTFYKSKLFRPKLDHYIRTYLNDTLKVYCEFIRAEDATLVGTAVAGLLN